MKKSNTNKYSKGSSEASHNLKYYKKSILIILSSLLLFSCTEKNVKVSEKKSKVFLENTKNKVQEKVEIPIPYKKPEKVKINTSEYLDDFYYLYDKKNELTKNYIQSETEYEKYKTNKLLNIKKEVELELKLRKVETKKETIKISPNKNYIAYSNKYNDLEPYKVKIKNIKTGKIIEELANVYGNIEWTNDDKILYYCTFENNRSSKLYKYNLNTNSTKLVYDEKDINYSLNITKTISASYIILNSQSKMANEILYIGAREQATKLKVFMPRKEGVFYDIQHNGYKFIVLTNSHSPNYKIMAVNVLEEFRNTWEEVFSNNKNQKLNKLIVNKNDAIVFYTEDNLEKIKVINLKNFKRYNLEFNGNLNYDLDAYDEEDYNSNSFKFKLSSLTTPEIIYKYNTERKTLTKYQQQEVYNYNQDNYTSKKLSIIGKNGNITVSIVSKKPNKNENSTKMLLNFAGQLENDFFHPEIVSLLDRGYSIAYLHINGGKNNCQEWFESKDLNFKRDFIYDISNTIDYLVDKKLTSHDKISAYAKDAGGLALQILANIKPASLKNIIINTPYAYDFRKYIEKKEDFFMYQLKTAPYYNIQDKKYPNIFIQTYDGDLEALRYIAKLRTLKNNNSIVSLKFTEKDNSIEYLASNYSFLIEKGDTLF